VLGLDQGVRLGSRCRPIRTLRSTSPLGPLTPGFDASVGARGVGVELTPDNGYVTQQEAARLAGCSKDTIIRARQAGRLPHARLTEGRWTVPTDDLVAAGLCDANGQNDHATLGTAEGDNGSSVAVELARALTQVAALEDVVERQDGELAFLRQLTADTLSNRKAG
jgi:hypothetical protein